MRIEVIASGSTGNCYWLSDGESHLLLDAGIPRKQIAEAIHRMKLPGVDAAVVSHEHMDHAKAVKELLRLGVECYMSRGTAKALGVTDRVHLLAAGDQQCKGTWMIRPFAVEHDAADPLGFVLHSDVTGERLLYATDTQFINPRFGDGCSVVMVEANYLLEKIKANVRSGEVDQAVKHRVLWNHQSIDTVLKFLRGTDRSKLQEVVLLHLSDSNSDEVAFKQAVQRLTGCAVRIA